MGPDEVFFQGPEGALGIGVAFRIVPGSEDLFDAKRRAGLHEKLGSRLAAVVADKLWRFRDFTNALRKLLEDSMIKSLKPVPGLRLETEGEAHDFLGVPIKHNDQVHPAPVTELDLGLVNAPVLVDALSSSLTLQGSAASSQAHVFSYKHLLLFHDAVDALLVDWEILPVFEIGPDAPVAPERVLGLQVVDALKQWFISFVDGHGMAP